MNNKVILPIRLDSYAGDTSALEAHLFNDKEEYGGKSVPDDSMWAAVYILNGKIDHSLTEYGYRSLEELLKTHKNEKIIGLRENRKDAEDTPGVLLAEDWAALETKWAQDVAEERTGSAKVPLIDRDEVFYSLCVEDILSQAKEMRIPRKKLTPEVIKQIENRIEDSMGSFYDRIQDAISEVIGEKEAQTNEA